MTELTLKLWLTAALVALDAAWIALGGFSFDAASAATCLALTGLLAAIAFFYTRARFDERLSTMATEAALLMIFSAAACVFSYLITTLNRPLIDDTLNQWDAFLGFDWYAYVRFANAHDWVGILSSVVYETTLVQVGLTVFILPLLGLLDRVREITLLVMISSVLCVLISGIVPSAGALAYFHPDASFYMQNHPVVDLAYKQEFYNLRSGLLTHFSLIDPKGLVAFPSYHVALSVIVMIAFRGVKFWFWPVVVLNTLVILSTPIDGGHHLADGLGGMALAFATLALVVRIRPRFRRPAAGEAMDACNGLAGQKA